MKKIHVVSLGCPKARVDTEQMLTPLLATGEVHLCHEPRDADLIVVNTCGFIESASQESIDTILELADVSGGDPNKLVVAGCLVNRYQDDLADALPEVGAFLRTHELADGVQRLLNTPVAPEAQPGPRFRSLPGTAYLKVSEGCSRACSFCTIPDIRGPQRSRTLGELELEARSLVGDGVKELVLVAQELTSYGVDLGDKRGLATLLDRLEPLDGLSWIRLMYCYPWNFREEVLAHVAGGGSVVPYVDMPLQHISNRILRAMNRDVKRSRQERLIERLKGIDGMVLRTTLMTGFPGETEAEFKELLDWVCDVEFDRVGVFAYSPEEGTPAAQMDNQVPAAVAEERREVLLEAQQAIHHRKMEALKGRRLRVLVDGASEEHHLVLEGRYYGQAPEIDGVVFLSFEDGGSAAPGDFVEVIVTDARAYDLVGVVVPAGL